MTRYTKALFPFILAVLVGITGLLPLGAAAAPLPATVAPRTAPAGAITKLLATRSGTTLATPKAGGRMVQPNAGEAGYWQTNLYGVYDNYGFLLYIYGVCNATTNQPADMALNCELEANEGQVWTSGWQYNYGGTSMTLESPGESPRGSGTTWGVALVGMDSFSSGYVAQTPNFANWAYWAYYTEP